MVDRWITLVKQVLPQGNQMATLSTLTPYSISLNRLKTFIRYLCFKFWTLLASWRSGSLMTPFSWTCSEWTTTTSQTGSGSSSIKWVRITLLSTELSRSSISNLVRCNIAPFSNIERSLGKQTMASNYTLEILKRLHRLSHALLVLDRHQTTRSQRTVKAE